MMPRRLLVFVPSLLGLALLSCYLALPAFGQTPNPAPATPAAALTVPVVVVTLLALVLGFVNQAVNTGSFLGRVTIPRPWLPWLTLVGSFLGGLVTSLQGASSVTELAVFDAIVAGALALMGAASGAALQAHTVVHKGSQAIAALKAAASSPPAPPPRGFIDLRIAVKLALAGAVLGVLLVVLGACGSSAFPTLERIVQTVASDLQAGKNDAQMASDVCGDLGGSSMTDAVCADAEVVVADVVAMLVQTGSLSGQAAVNAKAFQQRHGILKGGGK